MKLNGKEGIRKWLIWQYEHVADYKLEPVNIIIEGNVFFEEFVVRATLYKGKEVESKQTEVLIYNDDYKVKETAEKGYFLTPSLDGQSNFLSTT